MKLDFDSIIKLETWLDTLESKGFGLSKPKVKYIEFKFSKK